MYKLFIAWPVHMMEKAGARLAWEHGPSRTSKDCKLTFLLGMIFCLLIPLALMGCNFATPATASAASPSSVVTATADKVVIEGGRALVIANLAYQTVGTAAAIGIEQGVITGETKVKVKLASQKAYDALATGQKALLAGDKAASAVAAIGAIDQLCALHPVLATACAAVR